MERIINIQELLAIADYTYKERYSDIELNHYFNYWYFLEVTEEKIMQELTDVSLETILYSKYYWSSRYIDKLNELYGIDAGAEQQRDTILNDMEQRLDSIDWEFIQKIEEGKV